MPTTQSDSFYKSIKFFGLTVLLMFSGPGAIYEAFKNENHPLYLPVLILGFILSLGGEIAPYQCGSTNHVWRCH